MRRRFALTHWAYILVPEDSRLEPDIVNELRIVARVAYQNGCTPVCPALTYRMILSAEEISLQLRKLCQRWFRLCDRIYFYLPDGNLDYMSYRILYENNSLAKSRRATFEVTYARDKYDVVRRSRAEIKHLLLSNVTASTSRCL